MPDLSAVQLDAYLEGLLEVQGMADYCPNGLQVEGRPIIKKIVAGVSANQALIDATVAQQADALLVHHGFFFKGEPPCVRGIFYKRLAALIKHDINLFAYHLPLDTHPIYGNNAQLAQALGCEQVSQFTLFNTKNLGWLGEFSEPVSLKALKEQLATILLQVPKHFGDATDDHMVKKLAWCTGAAQDGIHEAFLQGADVFISGEVSERTVALAKEYPIEYLCCGHHATERSGVRALGAHIAEKFNIECVFVDVPNDV